MISKPIQKKLPATASLNNSWDINSSMTKNYKQNLDIKTAGDFLGLSLDTMLRNLKTGDGPICHEDGLSSIYCEGSLRDWALMKGRGVNPKALQ